MRAVTRASFKIDGGSDEKSKSCTKAVKKTAPIITKYQSIISTRKRSTSREVEKLTILSGNLMPGKKDVAPVRKYPTINSEESSSTARFSVKVKKNPVSLNLRIPRDTRATAVRTSREARKIEPVPAGKSSSTEAATIYSIVAVQKTKKQDKIKLAKNATNQIGIAKNDVAGDRKRPVNYSGKSSVTAGASVKGASKNPVTSNPRKSRDIRPSAVQPRRESKKNLIVLARKSNDVVTTKKTQNAAVQKTTKQMKSDKLKDSSGKDQKKNVKVTAAREIEKKGRSANMKNLMLGAKPVPAIKHSVSSLPTKKSPKKSVPMLNRTFLKKLKGRPLTSTELKRLKRRPLTAAELKKLGPIVPRKQKPKEFEFKGSEWSGNSDDEGSVDFALLDEDLCYECGLDTSDEANWSKLIICDACDGEYHMACVRLDRVPRNGYCCPKCYKEEEEFSNLKFTVGDHFEIPRRKKGQILTRCYSPSRPLDVAFEECKRKGFMLVSQLFSYELMRQLTHGVIQKLTSSGRIADIWEGATAEISKRLGNASHNLVDRQGRFDMRIPEFVVEKLKLTSVLEPLLNHLRSIMAVGKKVPELRTHNIVFVPVGSKEQIWHVDDCVRRKGLQHRYFTILVQLNMIDENCGGTEVWSKELVRGDLIRGRPGDAFVFPGSLLHRGRGNEGNSHRFFYYASFSSETDNNSY